MGGTTNFVYPGVSEMLALAGKKTEANHPVSMFINAIYQPVPATQINITTNMTNSQSHQVCCTLLSCREESNELASQLLFPSVDSRNRANFFQSIGFPLQHDIP